MPHYHLEWFRKGECKARDVKEANWHSYKQQCKSAAFFAYDKTAQLEMIDKLPLWMGKRILRLEVQLRRKGMKKWVSENDMDSTFKTLKKLNEKALNILGWYLKRMDPTGGEHIRYEDAASMLSGVKNHKTRERMLYLLRKTSNSRDLTQALKKLREKHSLSSGQSSRVLKKFGKRGISPITIPNQGQTNSLPTLLALLV